MDFVGSGRVALVVLLAWVGTAGAQPPGPIPGGPPVGPVPHPRMLPPGPVPPPFADPTFLEMQRIRRLREFSWIYIDAPQPREILLHDIITIVVNEKSQTTVNSIFNRQRNANLMAQLRQFVRIGETGNLETAAHNRPAIDANLMSRMQSFGQLNDSEGMSYRIAATVVDVLPNGNVVIEARKSIRTNKDVWEFSLTGILRSDDINRDNTAFSEDIANLQIVKRQKGKVYDSTKRMWGVQLYDLLSPF